MYQMIMSVRMVVGHTQTYFCMMISWYMTWSLSLSVGSDSMCMLPPSVPISNLSPNTRITDMALVLLYIRENT